MKVLILGLPRTGTQSLANALEELGIGSVYHMREVAKNGHQAQWIEALESKFENSGKPLGREQFDKIFAGYEALADYPAAIFPLELLAAYPVRPVILTTRPVAAWHASMGATLIHAQARRAPDDPAPMAQLARKYHHHCWGDDFEAHGDALFAAHNALVREAVARDGRKFLEFDVKDGWGPLCEFLGMEVPNREFPRADDWVEYKQSVDREKLEKKEIEGAIKKEE